MRKDNARFMPSPVLDNIYDMIADHIVVAANEDIYDKDIISIIVDYLDSTPLVRQLLWEDYRNGADNGGMLILYWEEKNILQEKKNTLHCEHFLYIDDKENY